MKVNRETLQIFIEMRLNEILNDMDIKEDKISISDVDQLAQKLTKDLLCEYAIDVKIPGERTVEEVIP